MNHLLKIIESLEKENDDLKKEKRDYNFQKDILSLKYQLKIQKLMNENYKKTSKIPLKSQKLEKAYNNHIFLLS